MARIDFHYVPTSGDLPGVSFEKQTETAFNELGHEISAIDTLANDALTISNTALDTSNKALVQAQEADTRSQDALQRAKDAQDMSSSSNAIATESKEMAEQAYDTSRIAQADSSEAQEKSTEAFSIAEDAKHQSTRAEQVAASAETIATTAQQLASEAFEHAANGIPLWDEEANYIVPSICYGDDNNLYEAILSSGPETPTGENEGEYVGSKNPTQSPEYWKVFAGAMSPINGILRGAIFPFSGAFGGQNNKHPINRTTGQPDVNYALCDGGTYTASDGLKITTPDLRGRFIFGADHSHSPGATGGNNQATTSTNGNHTHTQSRTGEHTLTIAQIPGHSHSVNANVTYDKVYDGTFSVRNLTGFQAQTHSTGGGGSHSHSIPNTNTTGNHSHTIDVLPPYYALAYVIAL